MEELKDKGAEGASEAPEDEAPAGGKFRLTKRKVIIALCSFFVLTLVVGGAFAYRAHVQQQEVAAAQKRERLAREAAAEAAALEQAKAFAKESRRAHEALMAASPPAAELAPPPSKPTELQDKAKTPESETQAPSLAGEKAKAEVLAPASDAVSTKVVGDAPASKGAGAEKASEVSAPNAAGGCTVTGGRPEDYGKALGRCLEEFNRLEGRKP